MGDDKDDPARMTERDSNLAKESGISGKQVRDLIRMLGTARNSLLRQARMHTQRR